MKLSRNIIRKLIVEELSHVAGKGRLSDTSIDDQIDSLLIRFESESMEEMPEDQEVREESRRFSLMVLLEAPGDEDEEPEEDSEEVPDEEPGVVDAPPEEPNFKDSSEVTTDQMGEPGKPPVDVDQFAHRVARLIQNYTNLLDIETVIMMRARNYLTSNYDEDVATAFEENLEKQFGLAIDPRDNEPRPEPAAGAGPEV